MYRHQNSCKTKTTEASNLKISANESPVQGLSAHALKMTKKKFFGVVRGRCSRGGSRDVLRARERD